MQAIKAIGYILKNTAAVTAIAGQRIYHAAAPQNVAFPYVVINTVSVNPYDTKSGAADLDQVRLQIDSFDKDNSVAASLDAAIRNAIDRYPHGTVNGVLLDGVQFITTADFVEPDINNDGAGIILHFTSDYYVRVKYV